VVGCFLQSFGTSSPSNQAQATVGGFGGMPTQFSSNLGNPQPAPFGITPSSSASSVQIGFGQAPDNGSRFGAAVQGGGFGASTGFGQSSAHGSPFAAPSFQPQANGQGPAGKLFAVHTENEQPRGQHSGTLGCSTVGYQCLTAQPQFAHLSLEECRLEDYGIKEQVILALLARIGNLCTWGLSFCLA